MEDEKKEMIENENEEIENAATEELKNTKVFFEDEKKEMIENENEEIENADTEELKNIKVFFENAEKEKLDFSARIIEKVEEAKALFKDGKISPSDVPALLKFMFNIAEVFSDIMNLVGIDHKVLWSFNFAGAALKVLAEAIEERMEKFSGAWNTLAEISKDGKIKITELRSFIFALNDLIQVGIDIVIKYLPDKINTEAKAIIDVLLDINGFIDKFRVKSTREQKDFTKDKW